MHATRRRTAHSAESKDREYVSMLGWISLTRLSALGAVPDA